MQTSRGVPNILAAVFTVVALVVLALGFAGVVGVYDAPFPFAIYAIITAVNLVLAWILWRLT
ncbi:MULTISPECIES: hypothetical protein [Haloferax]|uniref:Uncharacterized protein n=1 Tax=Haloferax marinum TaxID=2666143 RepID=A0A6A8G3B3_9EURY|nr:MULTISPECIES: hypothetical protein [Haloferax]KAB1196654.1 hypothetical protein Hfx1150_03625 [Haloferax sp. CBA1150]MRW95660.1 hypothetical protein [Haloferax marinum]